MTLRTPGILAFALTAILCLPAQAGWAGTISGKVQLKGKPRPAVVYVSAAPGTVTPPAKHPVIDQRGMKFIPHMLPVVVGTTVDFLNSDSVNHNVFSPDNEGFNLGTWAKGETRSYTFKKDGAYTILCSIHPEMEAFVVVLDNPHAAVADADGSFKIEGVPDGHYVLKVFAKKLKKPDLERGFPVDVKDGAGSASITF